MPNPTPESKPSNSIPWKLSPFIALSFTFILEEVRANTIDSGLLAVMSFITAIAAVVLFLISPAINSFEKTKE